MYGPRAGTTGARAVRAAEPLYFSEIRRGNSDEKRGITVMARDRARSARVMRIVVLSLLLGTVSCQSEDRRAFNDVIDQEEANAGEQVQLYEAFETELLAELRSEYGTDAEGGCPELRTLPAVSRRGFSLSRDQSERDNQRIANETAARTEAWVENIPGEHCTCVQETLRNVRTRRERIDLAQFDEAREQIAEISDEALTQRIAFTGLPEPGFSPDAARNRIAEWNTRRHEDWRGGPDRWNENETRHGWEDYRYEARGTTLPETDRPLLTTLRWNYISVGCSDF